MDDDIVGSGPGPSRNTSGPNNARPLNPQKNAALDRREGQSQPKKTGIVQPKPQALAKRSGPSSVIVSPRQKGNPILNHIKSMPWEYGDIPADYVLGITTCALFLSLKYHRLHPEYIYTRIKQLQGKYNLRVLLTMVDIDNHEEALKELSKTSLINSVTIILTWSSAEAGRYLELFKTYENSPATGIQQHQSTTYSDRMVDFITTPRSINKTDAVSLVSQFGTIKTAVNARHEDISGIAGWGEKKVQRWCAAVREPFRVQRTAKRALDRENTIASQPVSRGHTPSRDATVGESGLRNSATPGVGTVDADLRPDTRPAENVPIDDTNAEDEEALAEAMTAPPLPPKRAVTAPEEQPEPKKRKPEDDPLSDGVMAALSKLRKDG